MTAMFLQGVLDTFVKRNKVLKSMTKTT